MNLPVNEWPATRTAIDGLLARLPKSQPNHIRLTGTAVSIFNAQDVQIGACTITGNGAGSGWFQRPQGGSESIRIDLGSAMDIPV